MDTSDAPRPLPEFDSWWEWTDISGTEQRFRTLLATLDHTAAEGYRSELLSQLARTEGLQGRFAEAHATLDAAGACLDESATRARVRVLLERGRVLNTSGDPAGARQPFLEAWRLAHELGETYYEVDAAHMLAIVASPVESLEWNRRALEVTERATDARTRTWFGPLLNNMGWTYHDLGHFEDALDAFQRALEWRRQEGKARETRIAAYAVGRALRSLGRFAEALQLQEDNAQDAAAHGEPDGYIQEEIAELLWAEGEEERARQHFAAAHALLSQDAWLQQHEGDRLERLRTLGAALQ